MVWKTYLIMYFRAGGKASEIIKKVESVGFKTTFGPVDFIYEWGKNRPTKEQVLKLADKLSEALKDTGAMFNIDTHETP